MSKILDFDSTSNLLYELQWLYGYSNVEVWNFDHCKLLFYMKNCTLLILFIFFYIFLYKFESIVNCISNVHLWIIESKRSRLSSIYGCTLLRSIEVSRTVDVCIQNRRRGGRKLQIRDINTCYILFSRLLAHKYVVTLKIGRFRESFIIF